MKPKRKYPKKARDCRFNRYIPSRMARLEAMLDTHAKLPDGRSWRDEELTVVAWESFKKLVGTQSTPTLADAHEWAVKTCWRFIDRAEEIKAKRAAQRRA